MTEKAKKAWRLESLRIGPEKNFCYFLLCTKTGEGALFDPAFEAPRVTEWCQSVARAAGVSNLQLKYLIATHGHRDHAGSFNDVLEIFPQTRVACHTDDVYRLRAFGTKVDLPLVDEQMLSVGIVNVRVLHTPGHSEGGCCFLWDDVALTGDTLFIDQCGRTDLPGGNDAVLFNSLQKIKTLPPYTFLYPGHDYGPKPYATLSEQLKTNPTLQANSLEEFLRIP